MEFLELISLYLIQYGIMWLLVLFFDVFMFFLLVQEYNDFIIVEYECIRDFLILYYIVMQCDDLEFWRYCVNMFIFDWLKYKIEYFQIYGMIILDECELFYNLSWIVVYFGQGIVFECVFVMV